MIIKQITATERELLETIEHLTTALNKYSEDETICTWKDQIEVLTMQRDAAMSNRDYWREQVLMLKADIYQHAEAMVQFEAPKSDAERMYRQGWINAAKWAQRDDLIADIDSYTYAIEMSAAFERMTP